MQASDIPSYTPKKFAQDASGTYQRSIPQTTVDPAAASFSLGFPPQTFTDEGAGGTPPDGRDVNGILGYLSAWAQWSGLGGPVPYNPSVSSNGGYPKGARVASATTFGVFYRSLVDNNVTNPDAAGAGWLHEFSRGTTSGVQWRTWPDGLTGGSMIRMGGSLTFFSETNTLVSFPFTLDAVTDYGVSTVIPTAGIHYNQVAQVVGAPSTTQVNIMLQAFSDLDATYPIGAQWWVEGVLAA